MTKQKKYINPSFKKGAFAQKEYSVQDLANGILSSNISMLSRAITLVESETLEDRSKTDELLSLLQSRAIKKDTLRIAISGSPGVGKSTFIESLVKNNPSSSLAILTVDPSSSESSGSILGDKTRMEDLVENDNIFIRPSPAGKTLGGVTHATREAILLCEAAGFDKIFIETVGVGQSETAVSKMVDFFILLILPGSGDEVQGIKRGIVELADLVLVSKSDGDRIQLARESQRAYKNALHLFRQKYANWTIPVFTCSAYENSNIDKVWQVISDFDDFSKDDSWISKHRSRQILDWYNERLHQIAFDKFIGTSETKAHIKKHHKAIERGENRIWSLMRDFR